MNRGVRVVKVAVSSHRCHAARQSLGECLLQQHKLGRGYDPKEEQELLESDPGGLRRHGSNVPLSRDGMPDGSHEHEAQVQ